MKIIHSLLFLLAALLALPSAYAARTTPLVNYEEVLVATPDGKPTSAEHVRKAIIAAASRTRWAASAGPGNAVRLTYSRGGHTAVVDVAYSAKSYSIRYADSSNLNYTQDGGKQLIHPTYNKQVNSLRLAIDVALRSN